MDTSRRQLWESELQERGPEGKYTCLGLPSSQGEEQPAKGDPGDEWGEDTNWRPADRIQATDLFDSAYRFQTLQTVVANV